VFDFENALKLIVVVGAGSGVLIMIGLAVKILFFRRRHLPEATDHDQLEGLEDRLLRTEAKVNELEERLDFAERMLTEVRGRAQLPGS
jgi:hypothetical protein